jgi:abortive infection bacteriophage resistance protein
MPKIAFKKPALTISEQIDLLETRGLIINNREKATHYLQYIGYYRFSGYLHPFKQADGRYTKNTTFERVLDLYIFDRKLRMLTFDAIERIEVACRNIITASMSENHGAFWFNKSKLFEPKNNGYRETQNIIKKTLEKQSKNVFIRHYYNKYDRPSLPPSWMLFETLSMGAVSKILTFLIVEERKKIAKMASIQEWDLVSWMQALTYTRNLCAHHSRLWNRTFTVKPAADKTNALCRDVIFSKGKFYAQSVVIGIFLDIISPESHWQESLKKLFDEHPNISIQNMGFPENWHNRK